MRNKRVLAIILAVSMVAGSMWGCQKKTETNSTSSTEEGKTETGDSNFNATGDKIVNEKITLDVVVRKADVDKKAMEEKEVIKAMEEKTNIHINWIEISDAALVEKVNIMLASDELPDLFSYATIGTKQLVENYSNGSFLPLNELMENYAPTVWSELNAHEDSKSYLTMDDGNIYAVPGGEMSPWLNYSQFLYVNKTWLDKLGLSAPTTTDEYYEVLKAFKEQDPNGNGIADEIPLSIFSAAKSGSAKSMNILTFAGAWGIPMDARNSVYGYNYITVKDGKAIFAPSTESFREFLTYFNKLYNEGLLDQESFSQSQDQFIAKGKNEDMILGSFSQFLEDTYVGTERVADYMTIPPLEGPNGDRSDNANVLVPQIGGVLTTTNEYPEATMRWIEQMNTDTYRKIEVVYGLESEGVWSHTQDGTQFILNSGDVPEGVTFQEWYTTTAWYNSPTILYADEVNKYRVIDERPARALAAIEVARPYFSKEAVPAHLVSEDLQNNISEISADLITLVDNFMAESILHGIDDNSWNEFQTNIQKANYEEFTSSYQEIIDIK